MSRLPRSHFAPFTAFLLSTPLLAQGALVVPPANANVEGNSLDVEPFAYDRITHQQYIDGSLLRGMPSGALINGIAYRRDWGTVTLPTLQRTPPRGSRVDPIWEVWMRNYTGPVLEPGNTLYRGEVALWSNVLTPQIIVFPDLPRGPGPVAAFDLPLMFDRPLSYGGGSLAIAHFAYETVATVYDYAIDAVGTDPTQGTVEPISATAVGCPNGENRCTGIAPNPGGGNLEFYLFGGKPDSVGAAFLGTNTSTWNGLPLPLDLAPIGLDCRVYTDLAVGVPTRVDIAGNAAVRLDVPADDSLVGASLFGQYVTRDDRVNPAWNLATSDGLRFTFGPRLGNYVIPMSVLSAAQNLARGRTGLLRRGTGAVLRISWQ